MGYKDADYFTKVDRLIKTLGMEKSIFCIGARTDVDQILKVLDIFVLPSLQEGFSNAVIEAMASGLPVVATKSGGTEEAVMDGHNGLLVSPGSSFELAKAMIRLLSDEKLRRILSDNARETIREKFTYKKMVKKIQRVIDSETNGNLRWTES